jgi:hypothetical protein
MLIYYFDAKLESDYPKKTVYSVTLEIMEKEVVFLVSLLISYIFFTGVPRKENDSSAMAYLGISIYLMNYLLF